MKRFFVLAAMAVSSLSAASFPSSAEAIIPPISLCLVTSALPVMVHQVSGTATIYFRPHTVGNTIVTNYPAIYNYYWSASVDTSTPAGAALVSAATAAVEHQTKILIVGDAVCPDKATNGSIGNVMSLTVNP